MASFPPTFKQVQEEMATKRKLSNCVAKKRRSGERCRNPTNLANRDAAQVALDTFEIPESGLITRVSEIAALCVCKRDHHDQAGEIGEARWARELQNTITHKYAQHQDRSLRSGTITSYSRVDPFGSELAMLRDTSSAKRLQITNLSNQNTMLEEELTQAERLIATYEGGINVTNRAINGLQEEKQDLQLQQIDLRKALERSEAAKFEFADELDAAETTIAETKQTLKKEKERCSEAMVQSAELQAQQDTLLITLERLTAATVHKQNQFELLQRKVTALELEVEAHKNQALTTEVEMKDLRSANLLVQQANQQLEGNTERLDALVQRLQTDNTHLIAEKQTLSKQHQDQEKTHVDHTAGIEVDKELNTQQTRVAGMKITETVIRHKFRKELGERQSREAAMRRVVLEREQARANLQARQSRWEV